MLVLLSSLVENENRLVQEGHQTNKDGGDSAAKQCCHALNAKPNDEHCSPIPAVKEPEETIEDIEQQVHIHVCPQNCSQNKCAVMFGFLHINIH